MIIPLLQVDKKLMLKNFNFEFEDCLVAQVLRTLNFSWKFWKDFRIQIHVAGSVLI